METLRAAKLLAVLGHEFRLAIAVLNDSPCVSWPAQSTRTSRSTWSAVNGTFQGGPAVHPLEGRVAECMMAFL